jgi:nucleoside-diphosphate-sugar epimerase
MPKFSILGASGFVGGALASHLADAGHQVFRPERSELGTLSRLQLGHVIYGLGVEDALNNPYDAYEAHVWHLANILRSCRFSSVTYLSSTRLYLGSAFANEDADLQVSPTDVHAIYNVTKIAGEQLCFATKNPAVRVVRLSNIVGFAPNGTSLIPSLIKNAINERKMRLTISPQSSKDYVVMNDVLDLLPRIVSEGRCRCYNVASGVNVSLGDIVEVVAKEFPSACEWRANAPTVTFPRIDIGLVRSEFAFSPRPALDALASVCAQFRCRFVANVQA